MNKDCSNINSHSSNNTHNVCGKMVIGTTGHLLDGEGGSASDADKGDLAVRSYASALSCQGNAFETARDHWMIRSGI
jgi:hypothetical protein